jgi:hypothetical protein
VDSLLDYRPKTVLPCMHCHRKRESVVCGNASLCYCILHDMTFILEFATVKNMESNRISGLFLRKWNIPG